MEESIKMCFTSIKTEKLKESVKVVSSIVYSKTSYTLTFNQSCEFVEIVLKDIKLNLNYKGRISFDELFTFLVYCAFTVQELLLKVKSGVNKNQLYLHSLDHLFKSENNYLSIVFVGIETSLLILSNKRVMNIVQSRALNGPVLNKSEDTLVKSIHFKLDLEK